MSGNDRWAGVAWNWGDRSFGDNIDYLCDGPAFVSCSDITCSDVGTWAGRWRFVITVRHASANWQLLYTRPVEEHLHGITGLYSVWDPGGNTPWAAPAVFVYEGVKDWHDVTPSTALIVLRQLAIIIASIIVFRIVDVYLTIVKNWLRTYTAYSYQSIAATAQAARPIALATNKQDLICRALYITQSPTKHLSDKVIADIAWKIIHGKAVLPIP